MPDEKKARDVSRRSVIATAALVPVAAITAAAEPPTTVLAKEHRRMIETFVDRLVPRDENGPSASECGVVNYIERSLADASATEKASFAEGLAAVDTFARGSHGSGFAELVPAKQDEVITAMENNKPPGFAPDSRTFFHQLRRLTLEGMFSDPFYGGNRGFLGWDLIRYPGPRLAVGPEEQKMRTPIKAVRTSAYGGSYGH